MILGVRTPCSECEIWGRPRSWVSLYTQGCWSPWSIQGIIYSCHHHFEYQLFSRGSKYEEWKFQRDIHNYNDIHIIWQLSEGTAVMATIKLHLTMFPPTFVSVGLHICRSKCTYKHLPKMSLLIFKNRGKKKIMDTPCLPFSIDFSSLILERDFKF